MVEVEIRGRKFLLCLTVAALDKINDKCGSLKDFLNFLQGGGDMNTIVLNTSWALALLMAEGEENRLICAELDGTEAVRQQVPDAEALSHILTPGAVQKCRMAVLTAVNESMRQDIEAEHSKNGDNAE